MCLILRTLVSENNYKGNHMSIVKTQLADKLFLFGVTLEYRRKTGAKPGKTNVEQLEKHYISRVLRDVGLFFDNAHTYT